MGLPVEAEQSSSDDDDERSHEEEGEDNNPYGQHGDGAASASAAAAAGYYPEVSTNIIATTAAAASARPAALAHHGRKHSLDDSDDDEHHYDDVGKSFASAPNADLPTTPPLPPLPVVPMMHNPPSSLRGPEPQQGGGGGLPTHHHHSHKASRLPASEFALYPQGLPGVGDDDSDVKFAVDDNEDEVNDNTGRQQHQSRRGSTESTDALETLTVELLVERARTWEELYYSERDYSKSLEERLLRLLGKGGRVGPPMPVPMPKRRKVGDTDALAA